jgi:RNA polymerase sigma-70 factor, ECF subfamily
VSVSTSSVIESATDGHVESIEELYREHHHAVTCYARTLTHDHQRADDLAQEAFLRTWKQLDAGSRPSSPRAYLCRAVRNLHLNEVRRERHIAPRSLTNELLSPSTAGETTDGQSDVGRLVEDLVEPDFADAVLEHETMRDAMQSLPPRYQAVLWDSAVAGYAPAEIAERLQLPSPQAASALAYRARQALHNAYLDQAQHRST